MNYLFVCRSNVMRSPFAAIWLAEKCKERGLVAEIKSAGLDVSSYPKSTPLTLELINQADKTIVMESYMEDAIRERFKSQKPIYVLHMPDIFTSDYDDIMREYGLSQEIGLVTKETAMDLVRECGPRARIGPALFRRILDCHLEDILK